MLIPPKLRSGDEVRVLALSRSLGGVMQQAGLTESDINLAVRTLESMGLHVSFGRHVRECNEHLTASIQHRLEDLTEALENPSVKGILAVSGGVGAVQLLEDLPWDLVRRYPKMLCGYSDIAYVCNAMLARSSLVSYYGPNFTSFMMRKGAEYTVNNFRRCLFDEGPLALEPAKTWSDDAWHKEQEKRDFLTNDGLWLVQQGEAEGRIVGGSAWCLNMLQGTAYFPSLSDVVLFLEQPGEGKATLMALDSALRSLAMQREFSQVRAVVLGRYSRSSGVNQQNLAKLIGEIPALRRLPVAANCDFGHTTPVATVPIGGRCKLLLDKDQAKLTLLEH